MHDAKGNDVHIVKEDRTYQLQLVSSCNLVNITPACTTSASCASSWCSWTSKRAGRPSRTAAGLQSVFFNGAPRPVQETMAGWFARMAGEMGERNGKR